MTRALRIVLSTLSLGVVIACSGPQPRAPAPDTGVARLALPAMKTPAGAPAPASDRSNASVARDFMDLTFSLESGRRLPVFSRFEGPVTLAVTGTPLRAVSSRDLDLLLKRLNREAGIAISRVDPAQSANITLQLVPKKILSRTVPGAACFVVPNVENWREFTSGRNVRAQDWTRLRQRRKMAIFIPMDVSAQEIRDCLHEEIAQALGPVNDLYRLTDSIFNDDNFHTVLTGFDMLVLRTYYDRDLQSGMTPDVVAQRLPGILARINPRGRVGQTPGAMPTTQGWKREIEAALGVPDAGPRQLAAVQRAVKIARSQGWNDNRLGFALYAQGRLALGHNTRLALDSFAEAEQIFAADPSTRLHGAHVAVQAAAAALSSGRLNRAVEIADKNSAIALAAENPGLLSSLLMIKATALAALGKTSQAELVRLDGLAWARYGLNSEAEIRRRYAEISALYRRPQRNTR